MKLKTKVLLGALGVTALTGGMLLINQTQASAIAYNNNGGTSYTNKDGVELTNIKNNVD